MDEEVKEFLITLSTSMGIGLGAFSLIYFIGTSVYKWGKEVGRISATNLNARLIDTNQNGINELILERYGKKADTFYLSKDGAYKPLYALLQEIREGKR